jgi:hypothetical protein
MQNLDTDVLSTEKSACYLWYMIELERHFPRVLADLVTQHVAPMRKALPFLLQPTLLEFNLALVPLHECQSPKCNCAPIDFVLDYVDRPPVRATWMAATSDFSAQSGDTFFLLDKGLPVVAFHLGWATHPGGYAGTLFSDITEPRAWHLKLDLSPSRARQLHYLATRVNSQHRVRWFKSVGKKPVSLGKAQSPEDNLIDNDMRMKTVNDYYDDAD